MRPAGRLGPADSAILIYCATKPARLEQDLRHANPSCAPPGSLAFHIDPWLAPWALFFALLRGFLWTRNCASRHGINRYNPQRAGISSHCRVAGVRCVCHHPRLLAANPSSRKVLALTAGFALSHPDTVLDCHVGCGCGRHREMAGPGAVRHAMELAACRVAFRRWSVDLPALGSRLQRCPAWWLARAHSWTSRSAPHHFGHTLPSPPSRLSGAPMRDACLERGNRVGGLLRVDLGCGDHRRHHDPPGR